MRYVPRLSSVLGISLFVAALSARSSWAGDSPAKAPYPHNALRRQQFGVGAPSFWLFEPASPTPLSAPVVVFYHGWNALSPGVYGAWIEHLVRSGHIVIFPRYQAMVATPPFDFFPNALASVRDALKVLQTTPGHVSPDLDRFALIGHSGGGPLAVQLAAAARDYGLPTPRAVVTLMPGEVVRRPYPNMADVSANTLLVVIVAESDFVVGDLRARQIFAETTAIPRERKKYIFYRSDFHGEPPLIAHHWAPACYSAALDTGDGVLPGLQRNLAEINALDRVGVWRVTDLTLAAAFGGRTLDEATDKGALFRRLGSWSDGVPMTPPVVADDLAVIPRIYPTNGLMLFDWTPLAGTPRVVRTTQR
jgi:acetyl esterase/lipase